MWWPDDARRRESRLGGVLFDERHGVLPKWSSPERRACHKLALRHAPRLPRVAADREAQPANELEEVEQWANSASGNRCGASRTSAS